MRPAYDRKVSSRTDFGIELAKEGIPLPFGNRFWASNWPTGKTPLPGLIVHLVPSVRSTSSEIQLYR